VSVRVRVRMRVRMRVRVRVVNNIEEYSTRIAMNLKIGP